MAPFQGTCEFLRGGGGGVTGMVTKPIPLACIDITCTGITALIQHLDLEFVSNHVLEIAEEQERIIYGEVLVYVYIYIGIILETFRYTRYGEKEMMTEIVLLSTDVFANSIVPIFDPTKAVSISILMIYNHVEVALERLPPPFDSGAGFVLGA